IERIKRNLRVAEVVVENNVLFGEIDVIVVAPSTSLQNVISSSADESVACVGTDKDVIAAVPVKNCLRKGPEAAKRVIVERGTRQTIAARGFVAVSPANNLGAYTRIGLVRIETHV